MSTVTTGSLPALTSGLRFPTSRRGARYCIEAVDRFLDTLDEELVLTEGDVERSLALAERIDAESFPSVRIMREGYDAGAVDEALAAIVRELRADPLSEQNALVIGVDDFLAAHRPLSWEKAQACASGGRVKLYERASVEKALAEFRTLAKAGDTHETHRKLRAFRDSLELARLGDWESGEGAEGEGYPAFAVDRFLALSISDHCSAPLSGQKRQE
ncbi:hypothetical protein M3B90_01610 [Dermabacter sp. p3-SID358]|uniref:hypothetical protein n=1 Tax=Dermabacter sp. p3-SID358 TaxID=2916114 RepID=UPI0021A5F9A2|nr:hypothetical protein [Dermabacter sp. p3-SID358]MCT1866232.1 hypothetical protein [Dermabacter sp. p3-SID358]